MGLAMGLTRAEKIAGDDINRRASGRRLLRTLVTGWACRMLSGEGVRCRLIDPTSLARRGPQGAVLQRRLGGRCGMLELIAGESERLTRTCR